MTAADIDVANPVEVEESASTEGAGTRHRVLAHWLSDASRSRLEEAPGIEIFDDRERAHEASLIVVSTRIPVGESAGSIAELATSVAVPIIAIVHPGGESTGVALLTAGAAGLVAEGNELAVIGHLGDGPDPSAFFETYETSLDRRPNARRRGAGTDADEVTRLRGATAMASRLSESPSVPRLGRLRIVGLPEVTRQLSHDGRDFFRRRISDQFSQITSRVGADLYVLGPADYGVVSDAMSVSEFERLARELVDSAGGFSPDRSGSLALAVGHAGPEATSSIDTLIELTERCVDLATEMPEQGVVSSERLATTLATSTELTVVNKAIDDVERRDPYPGRHGDRVSRHAVAIAEQLGLERRDLVTTRVAARYHDIGKLDLSEEAMAGFEDTLQGELLDQYKSHAARGATILRAIAGAEVADAVLHHHERWDGEGFPEGAAGDAIPLAARIISLADALDRWSISGDAPDRPSAEAIQKATELAGTTFDPTVVEAAVRVFGQP